MKEIKNTIVQRGNMRATQKLLIATLLSFTQFLSVSAAELTAVQIYSDNVLLDLIKENKHLSQVVIDDCQLVQDIEARAVKSQMPSYQFLWGCLLYTSDAADE